MESCVIRSTGLYFHSVFFDSILILAVASVLKIKILVLQKMEKKFDFWYHFEERAF